MSEIDLDEVGATLEGRVMETLGMLEATGMSPREADEFIRDCVFSAWWNWDYEPAVVTGNAQP